MFFRGDGAGTGNSDYSAIADRDMEKRAIKYRPIYF